MKDMIILAETVEGKRNKERGRGNQDVIGVFQDNRIVCASVNDGCSGCEYPRLAGEINAKIAETTARKMEEQLFYEHQFKRSIAQEYKKAMEVSGAPLNELCSTTAFVAIDKLSYSYIAFTCGDSGILSFDTSLKVRCFLEPKSGFRKSLTYFTNDTFAVQNVGKFRQGRLGSDIAGFILYTDGADTIADSLHDRDNPAERLLHAVYSDMYESEKDRLISELITRTSDDISVIIVAPTDDQRQL